MPVISIPLAFTGAAVSTVHPRAVSFRIIYRARAAVLNRRRTFEAGLHPVVDVTLASDVVRRHAVVR